MILALHPLIALLGGEIGDEPQRLVGGEVFLEAWAGEHARDFLKQERRGDQLDAAVERCVEREHGWRLG